MTLAQSIAKRMLERRKQAASVKAAPKPTTGAPKGPEPAQAVRAGIPFSGRATKEISRTATQSRPDVLPGKPVVGAGRPGRTSGVPEEQQPDATHVRALKRDEVGHRPPRSAQPFVPPRSEPDIRALVESFAPPPATPAPPPAVLAPGFRGSCKAVCATTGRQCRLPAHPGDVHRSERGPFIRVAAPGTTSFPLREALDRAALHQDPAVMGADGTSARAAQVKAAHDRFHAKRKSAHAGDATTTGLRSDDAPTPTTEAA